METELKNVISDDIGLPLRRLELGPVQPYGLIGAQAKPLSQNDKCGVYVPVLLPAALTLNYPVRQGEMVFLPAGKTFSRGGFRPLHDDRRLKAGPQP
jgi:hypothetical protein